MSDPVSKFAVGTPGSPPRIIVETDDMEFLAAQLQPGEVSLAIPAIADLTITPDGTACAPRQKSAAELAAEAQHAFRTARRQAYPDVGDQLDVIWKALGKLKIADPEVTAMLAAINAAKAANPKPE